MINFICVYKTGGNYNLDYIVRLRRAIARHYSGEHTFTVMTDDNELLAQDFGESLNKDSLLNSLQNIITIPLKYNWPGWWSKIELFRLGYYNEDQYGDGKFIFLDLDHVICGSIDFLDNLQLDRSQFCAIRTYFKGQTFSTGMITWYGDCFVRLCTSFHDNAKQIMDKHYSDQEYIEEYLLDKNTDIKYFDLEFPGRIRGYPECRGTNNGVSNGARANRVIVSNRLFINSDPVNLIHCWGKWKPHLNSDPFVQLHWK